MNMIDMNAYITASGKYPERLKSKELTDNVKANAEKLLTAINAFLTEIGVDLSKIKVSSGFRPSDVNASLSNSAKKSLHMSGLACDLEDLDGKLDEKIILHPEILRKYGLFIENPNATPQWAHLDLGTRSDRPTRMFNP